MSQWLMTEIERESLNDKAEALGMGRPFEAWMPYDKQERLLFKLVFGSIDRLERRLLEGEWE